MDRKTAERLLMQMEYLRECSYEAETKKEEKQLLKEYNQIWKSIEPYVMGDKPYDGECEKS